MNTQLSTIRTLSVEKPHFFITPESLGDGLIALHLHVEHLPGDFLGVAFHMPISGGEWSFEGSRLEGEWALQQKNLFTLTSAVKGQTQELVFGLGLKGNASFPADFLHDGPVATFVIKTVGGNYEAEFQRAVLSLEIEGNRVDTEDVLFDGTTFSTTPAVGDEKVIFSADPMVSQELFGTQETDILGVQPGFVRVLGTNVMVENPYESVFQVYWVTIFFVLVLLVGAVLAYIWHRLLERKR